MGRFPSVLWSGFPLRWALSICMAPTSCFSFSDIRLRTLPSVSAQLSVVIPQSLQKLNCFFLTDFRDSQPCFPTWWDLVYGTCVMCVYCVWDVCVSCMWCECDVCVLCIWCVYCVCDVCIVYNVCVVAPDSAGGGAEESPGVNHLPEGATEGGSSTLHHGNHETPLCLV